MTTLTNETFDKFISESKKSVLVDFSAQWCGPCKMMAPVLEELAKERDDIIIATVDVDMATEVSIKNGVMNIPAFILFEDGEEIARTVGYMPKEQLLKELGLKF